MRKPSIKKLSTIVSDEISKAMREVFSANRAQLLENKSASDLQNNSFGEQHTETLRLTALNELGDFHGIEYAQANNGELVEYLNAGDSYNETIILWCGVYRVQSFGDFVEVMERRGIKFN